jgi:hypothetical protein
VLVHRVHGVPAPIEDVIRPVRHAREAHGLAEPSDDIRRKGVDALEDLDAPW